MTIDLIYQGIRLTLNKERKGFVKTSQITTAVKLGINNYFVKNVNEYLATGIIPEPIRPMVKTYPVTITNGLGSLPSGFEKEVSFTIPGINNYAGDFLSHDEFMDRRNSSIVAPTEDDPIAEIIGNTLRVEPSNATTLELIYIGKPIEIVYAETLDGDSRGTTFDAAGSTDTDFTISNVADIMKEALIYLGVKQQDQPATQIGTTTNK
jgi:hypothetical protein